MNRLSARLFLLISASLCGTLAWAQQPAPQVKEASSKEAEPARPVAPIASGRQLFGTFPVATKSDETRKLLETAIDQYENVLLEIPQSPPPTRLPSRILQRSGFRAVVLRCAATVHPRRRRCSARAPLLARATPDEALLVNWMLHVQEGETLKPPSAT